MLLTASRMEYGDLVFSRNEISPASMSRSAMSTLRSRRPISTATWMAIVVAPQPPLAEKKAIVFPPPRPTRRLHSTDLRSRAFLRLSCSGG